VEHSLAGLERVVSHPWKNPGAARRAPDQRATTTALCLGAGRRRSGGCRGRRSRVASAAQTALDTSRLAVTRNASRDFAPVPQHLIIQKLPHILL